MKHVDAALGVVAFPGLSVLLLLFSAAFTHIPSPLSVLLLLFLSKGFEKYTKENIHTAVAFPLTRPAACSKQPCCSFLPLTFQMKFQRTQNLKRSLQTESPPLHPHPKYSIFYLFSLGKQTKKGGWGDNIKAGVSLNVLMILKIKILMNEIQE